MIKAVILDLDDTLYAYEPLDAEARSRVRDYACEQLGITKARYDEAYQFGRSETKRQLGDVGASHNRMLYYQKTLEYLGENPMPLSLRLYETYWGTFLEKMTLFEGVREFIDCLHEHKIKVMICTDLTAHIQHRKIEALGLAQDICCLVTSEEAGREKPSREVFDLCLKKLELPPEEVCCIGDSLVKDVEGAKAIGMHAILFHPKEPRAQQYEAAAQVILRS
ncbi:MAG: HAD family hydrolase [Lachnospiraceae bacterium]|nr:HAD family hydrolase [Lachnospiraceae bacterium]